MLHYLAIDTGGSKTRFAVFDSRKNIVYEEVTEGFGIASDSDRAIPLLTDTLRQIAAQYDISAIAVNLGGKNKGQISASIKQTLPHIPYTVCRESEGTASLAFGKMCDADVVLLAGTGTIAIGCDKSGSCLISGGWGMNIGDQGSGYAIGLEAIQNSLISLDSTEKLSPMQKEITGREKPIEADSDISEICNARDEVRARIFPPERKHIASFAKIVARHCESGDINALEFMNNAGREMGMLSSRCARGLLPYRACKIAVSGGLVGCRAFWQKSFEDTVRANSSICEFEYNSDGVMLGTMELALNLTK